MHVVGVGQQHTTVAEELRDHLKHRVKAEGEELRPERAALTHTARRLHNGRRLPLRSYRRRCQDLSHPGGWT